MIITCLQINREHLSLTNFLRVHSNTKEASYLPWQNKYPKLKAICYIKQNVFLNLSPSRDFTSSKISHISCCSFKNIIHFLLLKMHPISIISVVLHYEKLCRAPTSANDAIFRVILANLYFDSFSTKVSYFTADIFFVRKGAKKTPQRTKILISPVQNKILKSETHFLSSK